MPFAIAPLFAFLFDPFLAAAAAGGAVSIPIVIHLLNRKRYRIVPWAAMRFLLAAQRKTSRKVRIEQILLLIVRCLLVLLLLLAMCSVTGWAEKFWHLFAPGGLAATGGTARTHKIIVVDGSLGMGLKVGDKDGFEKAKAAARQIVKESNGEDGFSVVLMAEPPRMIVPGPTDAAEPGWPSDNADSVLKSLDAMRPTHGNADLAATLNTVEDLLKASPRKYAEKEVYFLSNLQRATWLAQEGSTLEATVKSIKEQAPTAAVLDVGVDGADNLSVEGLAVADPTAVVGKPTLLQAVLHNFGAARRDAPVHFKIGKVAADGRSVDLHDVGDPAVVKNIEDGETVRVSFQYPFPEAGDYVVEADAPHDGLEADDARRVVVSVKDKVEVLLVDGKPAARAFDRAAEWVRTALNPYPDDAAAREHDVVTRPTVINETKFADEGLGDLTPYDCVFLCDVPQVTDGEARRLLDHVRRGGGVVFVMGDRVDLKEYNTTLSPGGVGLLPVLLKEKQTQNSLYSFQLAPEPDFAAEPVFKAFTDSRPREMLQAVDFNTFVRVEPAPEPAEPPTPGSSAKSPPHKTASSHTLLSFQPTLLPGKAPDPDGKVVAPPPGPAVLAWNPPAGKDSARRGPLRGRVVLVTTTHNGDCNSWATTPIFTPFIDRLMRFASAGRFREQSIQVGDPIELFLANAHGGAATIHFPAGRDKSAKEREESVPIQRLDDGGVLRWTGADTAGIYRIDTGAAPDHLIAVNPPAQNVTQKDSPSDPARATRDEVKNLFPKGYLQVVGDLHLVTHAPGAASVGEPDPVGPWVAYILLLVVLVLVFCEVVMAWLFGHYSAVTPLEEEAARGTVTGRRWALTVLPLYIIAGLMGALLLFVGFVLVHNAITGDFLGFLPNGIRRWMESLQGVAAPADGESVRWNSEYAPFWSAGGYPWLAGLVFGLGALGVLAVYFHEGRNIGVGRRLLMAGLRLGLLALLLLVLLPQLRVGFDRQGAPDVVIILDDSQSMSTVDHYLDAKMQQAADALSGQAAAAVKPATDALATGKDQGQTAAMTAQAGRGDRLCLAQTILTRSDPGWLNKLLTDKNVRLHIYGCSGQLHRIADVASTKDLGAALTGIWKLDAQPPAAPRPGEPAPAATNDSTRLGAAVHQVLAEYGAVAPAAVIVFTDGVTTEGESLDHASEFAKSQGVPLFFVGLGDPNEARNIRLHNLTAAEVSYVNDTLVFDLKLKGVGYPGLTVSVVLKEKTKDGEEVERAKTDVTLPTANEDVDVHLQYKPTEPGERTFIIETPLQPEEADKEDNRVEHKVSVRETKLIRVLYVEGYRRYEYHFLKTLLERESDRTKGNKTIQLKVLLMDADPEFAAQDRTALSEIPTKQELNAYNVIILGDVDPRPKGDNKMTEHLKDIAEWVTVHGGGLLMIAGERYAPFYYKDSPLKDVLPVDVVADRLPDGGSVERTDGYKPDLSPEGQGHAIFRFDADLQKSGEIWKHLREMYWWSDVAVPKPGAAVLAYHPKALAPADRERDAGREPGRLALVVEHRVGVGSCLILGFNETWRWGFREDQAHYNHFWIQMVRYLSGNRPDRVEVLLSHDDLAANSAARSPGESEEAPFRRGDPIKVTVRFPDDQAPGGRDEAAALNAKVAVQVERLAPDGGGKPEVRTMELSRTKGSLLPTYDALLTQTPEGLYRFSLQDSSLPEPRPSAECKVLPPLGEMDRLTMNQKEMEEAAQKTQGGFYTVANADDLLNDKNLRTDVRVRHKSPAKTVWLFWAFPLFFLAALLMLTAEWILRKQKNLV